VCHARTSQALDEPIKQSGSANRSHTNIDMDDLRKSYRALHKSGRKLRREMRRAQRWLKGNGSALAEEATDASESPKSYTMGQVERDALRRKHRNGNVNGRPLCDYCDYDGKPVEYPCDVIKALDAWEAELASLG
jgi:hypothetical protein